MNSSVVLIRVWNTEQKETQKTGVSRWRVLFEKLKDWLMEPIDFPGKLPENTPRPNSYNYKGSSDIDSSRD